MPLYISGGQATKGVIISHKGLGRRFQVGRINHQLTLRIHVGIWELGTNTLHRICRLWSRTCNQSLLENVTLNLYLFFNASTYEQTRLGYGVSPIYSYTSVIDNAKVLYAQCRHVTSFQISGKQVRALQQSIYMLSLLPVAMSSKSFGEDLLLQQGERDVCWSNFTRLVC